MTTTKRQKEINWKGIKEIVRMTVIEDYVREKGRIILRIFMMGIQNSRLYLLCVVLKVLEGVIILGKIL